MITACDYISMKAVIHQRKPPKANQDNKKGRLGWSQTWHFKKIIIIALSCKCQIILCQQENHV